MPTLSELSPEQRTTLTQLKRETSQYQANDAVLRELRNRSVEVISESGPVAVGKTALTTIVTNENPAIATIGTSTNRTHKASDPENFTTDIPLELLIDDIRTRNVVNYAVIEETGAVYVTYPSGLSAPYNIGPIAADNVNVLLNNIGSERYQPVYIISPLASWKQNIDESLGERPDTITQRMYESRDSLEFADRNKDVFRFVINERGEDAKKHASQTIGAIALRQQFEPAAEKDVQLILQEMIAHTDRYIVH
jgi:guanylate kinase